MSRVTAVEKIRQIFDLAINEKKQLKTHKHDDIQKSLTFHKFYNTNEMVDTIPPSCFDFSRLLFRKTAHLLFTDSNKIFIL